MPPRSPRPKAITKPPSEMTDEELQATGRIRVPVGPFGVFGTKIMTIRKFHQQQAARGRTRARKRKRRAAKAKKAVRQAVTGSKSKKKRKWLIPGIIYWE